MDLKRERAIEVQNLDKFRVGGEWFGGITYQGLLSVNTKTYVEEPVRANDGSMPNIEDYDTFIVPQVKFSLKYFSIGDYQRLCRVLLSSNQFPVSYFDKMFGEFRTYYMYAKPEEMAKLYNVRTSVFGVLDYEIEFVGTLNNLEEFTYKYILSGLTEKTIAEYSSAMQYSLDTVVKQTVDDKVSYYKYINQTSASGKALSDTEYWKSISMFELSGTAKWGNSIKIQTASDLTDFYEIPSGKQFDGWNTLQDGKGFTLLPNSQFSVFENLHIYPIFSNV